MRVRVVEADVARALGARVPAGVLGGVRLVEAELFDLQTCSGTHPARTNEVGVVVFLGSERHKGGDRLHFVDGARTLA